MSDIWEKPSGFKTEKLPSFSTDMNAAIQVIEHLRTNGFSFTLTLDDKWTAVFKKDSFEYSGTNISAPLACCVAALATVKP